MALTALLMFVSLIVSAAAHGWCDAVTIASKVYLGHSPYPTVSTAPSIIRQVNTNSPVTDLTSDDIICGPGATAAALVATAQAGDTVLVHWVSINDDTLWFHLVGPLLTYMANCGSASCADFDAKTAKWFKIQELGQGADGTWAQAKLDKGSAVNVTLPVNLAPGNYLLRQEIIALHAKPAELFVTCSQLKVTGSGSGGPTDSELVKFPGAYAESDPGIAVDVYDMDGKPYQFPGPKPAAFTSDTKQNALAKKHVTAANFTERPPFAATSTESIMMRRSRARHLHRVGARLH